MTGLAEVSRYRRTMLLLGGLARPHLGPEQGQTDQDHGPEHRGDQPATARALVVGMLLGLHRCWRLVQADSLRCPTAPKDGAQICAPRSPRRGPRVPQGPGECC